MNRRLEGSGKFKSALSFQESNPGSSIRLYIYIYIYRIIKKSVHLMITIQKVTSNVQSVPRQSPDIYWHARGTLDSH
jgi:hypothetical protein